MSDENPIDAIKTRAMELFPEDAEEREDYILGRMQRAGYKKGPGEWIRPEDDDTPQDDDDEPMTRADWRRMQRENARKAVTSNDVTPPKKVVKEPKVEKRGGNSWWS